MENRTYDIFVSHSSDNKKWVRTLVGNLKNQKLRIFFDESELHPGDNLVYDLDKAIESSRGAILVITPEAMNSGWVKKEYSKIIAYQVKHPDFIFIPLLLAGSPDFPFTDPVVYSDFRNPAEYRKAFFHLLTGLVSIQAL